MNPPTDIRDEDHRLGACTGRMRQRVPWSDASMPARGVRRDFADRDRVRGKPSGDDGGACDRPPLPSGQH